MPKFIKAEEKQKHRVEHTAWKQSNNTKTCSDLSVTDESASALWM